MGASRENEMARAEKKKKKKKSVDQSRTKRSRREARCKMEQAGRNVHWAPFRSCDGPLRIKFGTVADRQDKGKKIWHATITGPGDTREYSFEATHARFYDCLTPRNPYGVNGVSV